MTVSPRLETSVEVNEESKNGDEGDAAPPISKPPTVAEAKEPPLVAEVRELIGQQDAPPSAPPPSSSDATQNNTPPTTTIATLPPSQLLSSVNISYNPTPLPVAPPTLDTDYTERSGWLTKLSHRKGVFGDKWQKRYFVLHRAWLYYFKKYGVSTTLSF